MSTNWPPTSPTDRWPPLWPPTSAYAPNKLGDANYRWYNCNIQAPRIKCDQLDATTINVATLGDDGISTHSGYKASSTTHVFSSSDIPSLDQQNMAGELSLYLLNTSANVSNVTMSGITRVNYSFPTGGVVIYQRIGNFTSVEVAFNNTTNPVTYTCDPAAECRWFYRGI